MTSNTIFLLQTATQSKSKSELNFTKRKTRNEVITLFVLYLLSILYPHHHKKRTKGNDHTSWQQSTQSTLRVCTELLHKSYWINDLKVPIMELRIFFCYLFGWFLKALFQLGDIENWPNLRINCATELKVAKRFSP